MTQITPRKKGQTRRQGEHSSDTRMIWLEDKEYAARKSFEEDRDSRMYIRNRDSLPNPLEDVGYRHKINRFAAVDVASMKICSCSPGSKVLYLSKWSVFPCQASLHFHYVCIGFQGLIWEYAWMRYTKGKHEMMTLSKFEVSMRIWFCAHLSTCNELSFCKCLISASIGPSLAWIKRFTSLSVAHFPLLRR